MRDNKSTTYSHNPLLSKNYGYNSQTQFGANAKKYTDSPIHAKGANLAHDNDGVIQIYDLQGGLVDGYATLQTAVSSLQPPNLSNN